MKWLIALLFFSPVFAKKFQLGNLKSVFDLFSSKDHRRDNRKGGDKNPLFNVDQYNAELAYRNRILERQTSRENLVATVMNTAFGIASFVIYAKLVKKVFDSLASLKDDGGVSSVPENIRRFLAPNVTLNAYESDIVNNVIDPDQVEISFKALGGLSDIKRSLVDCVYDMLAIDDQQVSSSLSATQQQSDKKVQRSTLSLSPAESASRSSPTTANPVLREKPVQGILLFGPPGCGKTALVNALSKNSDLPIISVSPSTLLRKWVGDTSLLTRAVFSLAQKLQPCLIFVDEMDSLFRTRYAEDNNVDRNLKTEFMQLWDQMGGTGARVIIIGATNRPQDLDAAVQRRFERSFLVGPPDKKGREEVFRAILKGVEKESGFSYHRCAEITDGYTPSDIVALCKAALAIPTREWRRALMKERKRAESRKNVSDNSSSSSAASSSGSASAKDSPGAHAATERHTKPRPLSIRDMEEAAQSVFPTAWASATYASISGAPGANKNQQPPPSPFLMPPPNGNGAPGLNGSPNGSPGNPGAGGGGQPWWSNGSSDANANNNLSDDEEEEEDD